MPTSRRQTACDSYNMTQHPEEKKTNLVQRSRELLDTAVQGLKGRDLGVLVDEFTSEMTLVAEGLSEDLSRAQQDLAQLSAAHTIEEEGRRSLEERVNALQRRVDALEKKQDKQQQKRGTLTSVLRQVTVIAAILAGAWVITALLKTFGGA